MLDTDTKRRIDTARDILVGKVPDPKSQVEQITSALIYKFMDDMDAESEELGGKRKFFTGGHEMLGLYGEGIAKMPENPGLHAALSASSPTLCWRKATLWVSREPGPIQLKTNQPGGIAPSRYG